MAEALLITRDDLVRLTALGGNVDTDKFIQFVKIAQDIYIQNYLGTQLFVKLKTDIENSTLTNPYLDLLVDYVKPMLIHWAMVEYYLLQLTRLLTKECTNTIPKTQLT